MKSALTAFIAVSVFFVAAFGVFAMHQGSNGSHESCLGAVTQGTACPPEEGPFAFIVFHLGAFKRFSNVVFSQSALLGVLLLILLAFAIPTIFRKTNGSSAFAVYPCAHQAVEASSSFRTWRFSRWLAFHENSPGAASKDVR